jgi:1,2-dihydroxy-3-keto-5-methylthiopentene dioxygenase
MADHDPLTVELRTSDVEEISRHLGALGVSFARRPTVELPPDADAADILETYEDLVAEIGDSRELPIVDAAVIRPDGSPDWPTRAAAVRDGFRTEHVHAEDEIRFFAFGRGCFYLHIGQRVHAVVCGSGDLLSVPRGTRHWFDTGDDPCFAAIRFFERDDGWVADFAHDSIAGSFPSLDDLVAERSAA